MIRISNYTLISDVGETIIELLRRELIPEPVSDKNKIMVCSPAKKGDVQLSLYLYNIELAGEHKRTQMVKMSNGKTAYPPMALNLYYLLTAYSGSEEFNKSSDEHKILGSAIRVLYDNQIISGSVLKGHLSGSNQKIHMEFKNLSYDEMMRIWNFNDVPYNLSVAYKVGPIFIESQRTKESKPVVQAEFTVEYNNLKDEER